MASLLRTDDLHVSIADKEILHGIDLEINEGETHVIMGPNGAGKSTLGYAVMGHPNYNADSGKIYFRGDDITSDSADKRAKAGIYLSFQNPVEIPGISLSNFIRTSLEQRTGTRIKLWDFKKALAKEMELLNMDPSYSDRDLNVGFSGGEKKKAEILQLLMLNPALAILDETDSGLDVDAVKTVSEGVGIFQKEKGGALLIITHSTRILEALKVDKVHVLVNGKITASGGEEMISDINENGFEKYIG